MTDEQAKRLLANHIKKLALAIDLIVSEDKKRMLAQINNEPYETPAKLQGGITAFNNFYDAVKGNTELLQGIIDDHQAEIETQKEELESTLAKASAEAISASKLTPEISVEPEISKN